MSLRDNKDFRSIAPTEYIPEGNLVWIERFENDAYYDIEIEGPYVIVEGWGPIWFGSANQNKPDQDYVKLVSTITGEVRLIVYGSFLHQTFYTINEESLCTGVETK